MSRILIIDDDLDVCEILKKIFEEEGHSTVIAHNGAEAITLLETMQKKPDVVLVDLLMPVIDGYDFLRHVIKYKLLPGIPIMVVSGIEDCGKLPSKIVFCKKPLLLEDILKWASDVDKKEKS